MNTIEQPQPSQDLSSLESGSEPPTQTPGAIGIVQMSIGPLWPIWLTILVAPIVVLAAPGLAVLFLAAAVFAGPYVLVRYVLARR